MFPVPGIILTYVAKSNTPLPLRWDYKLQHNSREHKAEDVALLLPCNIPVTDKRWLQIYGHALSFPKQATVDLLLHPNVPALSCIIPRGLKPQRVEGKRLALSVTDTCRYSFHISTVFILEVGRSCQGKGDRHQGWTSSFELRWIWGQADKSSPGKVCMGSASTAGEALTPEQMLAGCVWAYPFWNAFVSPCVALISMQVLFENGNFNI